MNNRYVRMGKRTISLFLENDIPVYAGHATLSILTAIFPLLMLVISLLNMIPGYSPEDFTNLVFQFLPDLPQVKNLFLTIMTNLQLQSGGLLASAAAFTTLWSASSGVTAVQKGLKKITPDAGKSIWDKPKVLLFTFCIVALIPAVLVFNVLGETLISLAASVADFFGIGQFTGTIRTIIRNSGLITAAAGVLVIILLYRFLPGGKRRVRDQVPGAILASVGWLGFTEIFSRFVPIFWKSPVYGSLASLFLTLLWLRVMIMILFIGGIFNQVWAESRGGAEKKED